MSNKEKIHTYIKIMKLVSLFFFISICSSCGDIREPGYTAEEIKEESDEKIRELPEMMTEEQQEIFYKGVGVNGRTRILNAALDARDIGPEEIAKLLKSFSQENMTKALELITPEEAAKLANGFSSEHYKTIVNKSKLSPIVPALGQDNFNALSYGQKIFAALAINKSSKKDQIECLEKIEEYIKLKNDFDDLVKTEDARIWNYWNTLAAYADGKVGAGNTNYFTKDSVIIQDAIKEMKKKKSTDSDAKKRKEEDPKMEKITSGVTKIFEHAYRGSLIFNELRELSQAGKGHEFESLSTDKLTSNNVTDLAAEFKNNLEDMKPNTIMTGIESMSKSIKKYYKFLNEIRDLKNNNDVKKLKDQLGKYTPLRKLFEELEKDDAKVKAEGGLDTGILVKGIEELARLLVSAEKLPPTIHTVKGDPNEDPNFIAAVFRIVGKVRDKDNSYPGFFGCDYDKDNISDGLNLSWTPSFRPDQIAAKKSKETLETMVKKLAVLIYSRDGKAKDGNSGKEVLKMDGLNVGDGGNRKKMKISYTDDGGITVDILSCDLEDASKTGVNPINYFIGLTDEKAMEILHNLDRVDILGE